MVLRLLIKGGVNDFALDGALHVGNFLRTLIDEKHDELRLRAVLCDRICDLLQKDRLTCFRRGNDHTALTFTDRRYEVNDTCAEFLLSCLQTESLIRIDRCQALKVRTASELIHFHIIYGSDIA